MTHEELTLINKAQCGDDKTANDAMKELREKYDATYGWCSDCDYAVVKEKDCCMSPEQAEILRNLNIDDIIEEIKFKP